MVFHGQMTLAGAHSTNHKLPEALAGINRFGDNLRKVMSHQVSSSQTPNFLGQNKPQQTLKIQAVW